MRYYLYLASFALLSSVGCKTEVAEIKSMRERCITADLWCQQEVRDGFAKADPGNRGSSLCDWSSINEGDAVARSLSENELLLCGRWKLGTNHDFEIPLRAGQELQVEGFAEDMLQITFSTTPSMRDKYDRRRFVHTGVTGIASATIRNVASVSMDLDPFYGNRAGAYAVVVRSESALLLSGFSYCQGFDAVGIFELEIYEEERCYRRDGTAE